MELDPRACYRAVRTRDARFDGRFFTAVLTTGIFCRPVCPAPAPKAANCRFFSCAAAAQEAGFRPCLRCRPEASPGSPLWNGTTGTVSRALRLIAGGAVSEGSVPELAERLGVGERHLRRLFQRHLGTTPRAVAQSRRVLFAKRLIDETDLSMARIALASGFPSVRRFNAGLRTAYNSTPTELRRRRRGKPAGQRENGVSLRLAFRPPYDWESIVGFLALRATPGVEEVTPSGYRRTVILGGRPGWLEIAPEPGRDRLRVDLVGIASGCLLDAVERLRHLFDLDADPQAIAGHLGRDPVLGPRVAERPGLRLPGAWDGFELAVRAVLGQQVSVKGATTLAGRLAGRFGEPFPDPVPGERLTHLFPGPESLAAADVAGIGLPRARAETIRGLARAVIEKRVDFVPSSDLEATVKALREIPGVGDWTAHYVAMRAVHEPDAFPAGDLGIRHALGTGDRSPNAARVEAISRAWRPWRAYAAMHLWTGGTS